MKISFSPSFINKFEHLPEELQEEALEKIDLLKDKRNNKILRVHKLHGKLKGRWSFSINYEIRIIFAFIDKDEIVLMSVGSHKIYDR